MVKVRENYPFSSCSDGFSGIETDIVRDAMAINQYNYLEQYEFVCSDENVEAVAEFGGISIQSQKIRQGYKYSIPIYRG